MAANVAIPIASAFITTTAIEAAMLDLRKLSFPLLHAWHAVLGGGFLVSYLTADEDTYAMHQFAGYVVLAAIIVRIAVGLLAPSGHPWRLPRPSIAATRSWFKKRRGRNPFFAWIAVVLLGVVGMAALTGAIADFVTKTEDLHEGIAETSMWIVLGHIAFVIAIYKGRKIAGRFNGRLLPGRELKEAGQ